MKLFPFGLASLSALLSIPSFAQTAVVSLGANLKCDADSSVPTQSLGQDTGSASLSSLKPGNQIRIKQNISLSGNPLQMGTFNDVLYFHDGKVYGAYNWAMLNDSRKHPIADYCAIQTHRDPDQNTFMPDYQIPAEKLSIGDVNRFKCSGFSGVQLQISKNRDISHIYCTGSDPKVSDLVRALGAANLDVIVNGKPIEENTSVATDQDSGKKSTLQSGKKTEQPQTEAQ